GRGRAGGRADAGGDPRAAARRRAGPCPGAWRQPRRGNEVARPVGGTPGAVQACPAAARRAAALEPVRRLRLARGPRGQGPRRRRSVAAAGAAAAGNRRYPRHPAARDRRVSPPAMLRLWYGGTFDPVPCGHLALARALRPPGHGPRRRRSGAAAGAAAAGNRRSPRPPAARDRRVSPPAMLRLWYGGTFDPVHCGHLAIARAAADAFGVPVTLAPA